MRPFISYIVLLGCFTPLAATAAPPPTVPPPSPPPKAQGLMAMLQKGMTGHPVIAVGTGSYDVLGKTYDEAAFNAAKDELGRLQVISAAASTGTMPLIPFAVRGAWVIAPQMRQDLRTDFRGVSPLAASGYSALLTRALLALAPEQMPKAGDGVPVSQLSKEARQALALAVRPPFTIKTPHKATITIYDGTTREGLEWDTIGTVMEPVDWSKVRFRAVLAVAGALVQRPGENSMATLGRRDQMGPAVVPDWPAWAAVIAPYNDVPNAFRPSDLNTAGFQQPIGIAGVLTVKEVVARLAKVTGLHLHAMRDFEGGAAFIGSAALSCGDVMDGLRLALTGTWRSVGDNYVLAWDKPGWVADRLAVEEAAAPVTDAIKKLAVDQREDPAWLDVAATVPFAPDDPLAWTDDQRRKMLGLDWKPGTTSIGRQPHYPDEAKIPYSEMTPGQQAFLQKAAKTEHIQIYHGRGQPVEEQPYTAADVSNAAFADPVSSPTVDISLEFPGFGWVHTLQPGPFGADGLRNSSLNHVRNLIDMEQWRKERVDKMKKDPPPFKPKAAALPAKSRGILVSALSPAEVTALVERMKAHGLDTLLYPALDGGYATFSSKAVPLAPALRGKDGWAAASTAAKAAGVRLVAWLSPVAWQNAGAKVHWLDKHPGWWDVDALGRTRLAWEALQPPAPEDESFMQGPTAFNYVRPTEPEATRRLDILVDECARLPGAEGLAIVDWRPWEPEYPQDGSAPPPLGFALPDRIAALNSTGYDPVDDRVDHNTYANSAWRFPDILDEIGPTIDIANPPKPAPKETPPYFALAARVLARANADRKDWQTWRVDSPVAHFYGVPEDIAPPEPPKADISLRVTPDLNTPGPGPYNGFTIPVPPRSAMAASPFLPPEARNYPALAIMGDAPSAWMEGKPPAQVALYDFRMAPDEIMYSLRWIAPPDAK
jgi:hypothetical protein